MYQSANTKSYLTLGDPLLSWDLCQNILTVLQSIELTSATQLLPMIQVKQGMCRYLVKQESSASGSGEACGDKFSSVGQNGVTVGTGEETSATDVIQEDSPHCVLGQATRKTRK